MKTIATFAVCAALFGAIPFANAQTAPTTHISPSPSSINKSSKATTNSGAESRAAVTNSGRRVAGNGKYCEQTSASGTLDCFYASMSACHKHAKGENLSCVTNPDRG